MDLEGKSTNNCHYLLVSGPFLALKKPSTNYIRSELGEKNQNSYQMSSKFVAAQKTWKFTTLQGLGLEFNNSTFLLFST
jgi:hypothetical protein